jgi:hypothetical protein
MGTIQAPVERTSATPAIAPFGAGIAATFDIPVQIGWNFISVPLVQWNTSIIDVLDDQGGNTVWNTARWQDPVTSAWKTYFTGWPSSNPANNLKAVNHTMGIFLNISNAGSDGKLRVNGTLPLATTIHLHKGWNMVGYPTTNDTSFNVSALKAATSINRVQNYTSVDYLNSTILKRGVGYWMNATANCTWTIPNTPTGPKPTIALVSPANNSVIKPGVLVSLNVTGYSPSVAMTVNGGVAVYSIAPYVISTAGWPEGYNVLNVTASDVNGTKTSIFSFTIDSISPEISLLSPANNTLVRAGQLLDFNIQEAHLAGANYTRNRTVVNLTAPFHVGTAGWPDGTAVITVRAIDMAGNSAIKNFTFRVDGTWPRVTSTTPANGTIGLAVNAKVVIAFSERMNKSVTESSISIRPTIALSNFTWNADWTQLTLNFAANMTQSTYYRVTVGIIARDMAGNTLGSAYTSGFTTWIDTDSDGLPNDRDQDDDGDGYMDPIDAFPQDPTEWLDTDGDGIGNNADLDDDGDGIPDTLDKFPLDKFESLDSDGDGIGDNQDAFPNDPTESTDSDGDGVGDNKDFLPNFDNNLFYSLIVLAPCITAVLIALIVTRARHPRAPKKGNKGGETEGKETAKPEEEAIREPVDEPKTPARREPADPMAPPPED